MPKVKAKPENKTEKEEKTLTPEQSRKKALRKIRDLSAKRGWKLKLGSDLKEFEFLRSGMPQLDELGGPVKGRFVIIYGSIGSGKSTASYNYIAQAQKDFPDQIVLLVDAEGRAQPDWMHLQGVDLDNLIVINSEKTLEDYCNAIKDIVGTGLVSLCVIDTISAMTPKIMLEETASDKAMDRNHIAKDAIKIQQFLKITNHDFFSNETACLIIGQARTHGIGGMSTYEGLSGGNMQKHMALQIWQYRALRSEKDCEFASVDIDGHKVKVIKAFRIKALLEKDTGPNVRKAAYLPFVVGVGFDIIDSWIRTGLRQGCIVETSKARFEWTDSNGEVVKIHGKEKVVTYFKDNEEEYRTLSQRVIQACAEAKACEEGFQEESSSQEEESSQESN